MQVIAVTSHMHHDVKAWAVSGAPGPEEIVWTNLGCVKYHVAMHLTQYATESRATDSCCEGQWLLWEYPQVLSERTPNGRYPFLGIRLSDRTPKSPYPFRGCDAIQLGVCPPRLESIAFMAGSSSHLCHCGCF